MLQYLSVHDLVWINSTIDGKTHPFDYEKLEAAMAAQYSYGASSDVRAQAANLLGSLARKRPFDGANMRTALVATLAFLTANGLGVKDRDLASAVREVAAGGSPEEAINKIVESEPGETTSISAIRSLVTRICNERADALKQLAKGDE